jgi:hypothetical protein
MEVIGDLAKQLKGQKEPAQYVMRLAQKFGGSGSVINFDHYELMGYSLLGADVPMTGQIIPNNSFRAPNGLVLIEPSPWNDAILRWSKGKFAGFEKIRAEQWQKVSRAPSFDVLYSNLFLAKNIVVPSVKNEDELRTVVDEWADDSKLQREWLDLLERVFMLPENTKAAIRVRWSREGTRLRKFAPYAHFCLRVWLALVAGVHHRLLKWAPTHIIDVQYLHYLPFCHVFSSEDRTHRLLAPVLMRQDQSFVLGRELKAGLHREIDEWENLTPLERDRRAYALAGPTPKRDSSLFTLWAKYCDPRAGGNMITSLDDEQKRIAREELERWLAQVES